MPRATTTSCGRHEPRIRQFLALANIFQPPIALAQPRDLALEPFALDALKVAPQSFRRFPPWGLG